MKLSLIKIILIAIFIANLHSESYADSSDNVCPGNTSEVFPKKWELQYGPSLSFDILVLGQWNSTRHYPVKEPGLGVGAGMDLRLTYDRRWYFQSGVDLRYDTSKIPVRQELPQDYEELWHNCKFRRLAVSVPLKAGYLFSVDDMLDMSVFTGIGFSCNIAGSLKGSGAGEHLSLFGANGVWRRFNVSYIAGLSFELPPDFSVGINADLGLTRMAREGIFWFSIMNESMVNVTGTWWIHP